jgi:hypothetical protein
VPDRDLPLGLDEIELGELAGSIDRALIGPLGAQHRAQLPQIIIENRLRPLIARFWDQVPDAGVRDPFDITHEDGNLLAVRSSFDPAGGRE